MFSQVRSEKPGSLMPGPPRYSHFVGSPAFRLKNMLAFTRVLPWVRAVAKYHSLSLRIGPPTAPLRS